MSEGLRTLVVDLRALAEKWRADAAAEYRVSFCADELLAVLDAGPASLPETGWLRRILSHYADQDTKEACEDCDDCGPKVMCSFHSLLSLLNRRTFLDEAHVRSAAASLPDTPQETDTP